GEKLPMVYISSCASTMFFETDDTNMERLLRNPNGGAIGLIGATVDTYRGEFRPDPDDPNSSDSYGNWWLAQEFYRLLYGGYPRPGEALYRLKDNYQVHIWDELGKYGDIEEYLKIFHIDSHAYNLMGDPEGPIWLDEPREFSISNLPETFDYEGTGFRFRVTDASTSLGVPGAVVAFTDKSDPDMYIKAETGSNGWVEVSPMVSSLSTLDIVITREGYIPVERTIRSVSSWDIAISPEILLEPGIPVVGNGLEATFQIHNPGSRDIDEFFLYWTWFNGSTVQNRTVNESLKNGSSINITVNLRSWNHRGIDTITAWVSLPLASMVENDTVNNRVTLRIHANDPIEILGQAEIVLDEDKAFSEMYGRWLDPYTSSIIRVFDPDSYPEEPMLSVSSLHENISIAWDDDRRTLDIVPARDWSGKGAVLFTASDGSVTVSRKMNITVLPVPDPPRFIDFPREIQVFEDLSFNFTVEVMDIDSDHVNLSCDLDWINITGLGKADGWVFNLTLTPSDSDITQSLITLVATDDTGLKVELSLDVDVRPTNDPPRVLGPDTIKGTRGSTINVDLEIEDIDGDTEFIITGNFLGNSIRSSFTNFTLIIPENAQYGEQELVLNVSDEHGGYVLHTMKVDIRERDQSNFSIIVIVFLALALSFLLIWGVFLRVQDRKQMRMLDSVGTNAPLEARPLTEKDFSRSTRRGGKRRRKDDGIPMPPAPIEVEGALAREEKEPGPADEEEMEEDIETDIDDILSEMFP
ncbi:MAG: C25 family cysteine peptidase, partial [Thermoplasmatota archaeon]